MLSHPEYPMLRILILSDSGWEYSRNIILGVRHYAFTIGNIALSHATPDSIPDLASHIRKHAISGIIAQVRSVELESNLLNLGIPVVSISNILLYPRLPTVTQDDTAVGQLAARHLLRCTCTSFACWGQKNALFSQERISGFIQTLKKEAPWAKCTVNEIPPLANEEYTPKFVKHMARWLQNQPAQMGIFAVLDPIALQMIQAAQQLGRRIPDDIAILGTGNDEFWTDFENIPLSSVKLPSREIGFEAAAQLHQMMRGGERKPFHLRLPVTEISERQSTDVIFTKDAAVTRALVYIRQHSSENIYIGDAARAAGISRSALQARFRQILGHSILAEIQHARIRRVQTFLSTTDMKLTAIADACGFPSAPRLNVLFRKLTGQTPGQYRAFFRKAQENKSSQRP